MRVLITGAAGFIGRTLARELAGLRALTGRDGLVAITEMVLADRAPCRVPERAGFKVDLAQGDLSDRSFVQALGARGFDSIFHLAATLTLEAERDPDGAFAVNVEATRELIAAHRATVPRIVFASSIAVFGGALPESVDDEVRPMPMTTYGTHKAIAELLLADATRHGWVDGRALRLPIVLIRPGAPNPAVSDRVAAIVREPLAGRDVVCPLAPDTQIPVASARAVARALVRLHDLPASSLPSGRAMNLPALTVSIAEMVRALERQRRPGRAIGSVTFSPDPILQPIVDGWPKRFVSADASRLGLGPDPDLDEIYAGYLAELDSQHGRS